MVQEESLVTPEARAMIGKETGSAQGVVYLKEAQRWAAAVGDLNPIYWDEEAAKAQGYRTIPIPPMFLPVVLGGVTRLDSLREDGIPMRRGGDVPLKVTRTMAGGEDTEFYEPVYPGDVISSVTRIAAIEEKTGRSGRFVLVTRETVYTNQDGVVVARSRNSSIVR